MTFKCSYCGETFTKEEASIHEDVIGHVWYTTEKFYACPYCGNEDLKEIIGEDDDEYQEEQDCRNPDQKR